MTTNTLLFLPGDGIGVEVLAEAEKVARWFNGRFGRTFNIVHGLIGGSAFDAHGHPYPEATRAQVAKADAVMLGAVGGPTWAGVPFDKRPEQGLLDIRQHMGLYANLRPAFVFESLSDASTLKPDVVDGLDMLIVRELIGGIYFGAPRGIEVLPNGTKRGFNTTSYSTAEVTRIAESAFIAARARHKKVCSVDKANVLESSIVWREVVNDVAKRYADVALSHMYIDNAAMQLVIKPSQFDVILCPNLAGDILSDIAAALTGSIGMLASASLGAVKANGLPAALYEPVHGSAPDIAGKGVANPLAAILSFGLLLTHSFGDTAGGRLVHDAVDLVLKRGFRTGDIAQPGTVRVDTATMGEQVIAALNTLSQQKERAHG